MSVQSLLAKFTHLHVPLPHSSLQLGAVALFELKETFLFAYVLAGVAPDWARTAWFGAAIFFTNLADAYFIWVLIAIAAGYCITRATLGPHLKVAVWIPLIFFVTSLVVDYVLYSLRGFEAFSDKGETVICLEGEGAGGEGTSGDARCAEAETVGAGTGLVFFICIMANMMAFILAWFYIFETVQKERERLEGGLGAGLADEDGRGGSAVPGGLPPHVDGGALPVSQAVGHAAVPTQVLLEQGANASHLYGATDDVDADEPKTVQDRIENRDKLRLIRTFFYGVSAYVIATLVVIFLPIFVPAIVDRVILVLQNALLFAFMAALLWTFRMRSGNAYLVLNEAVGLETTTELGVLSHDDGAGPSAAGKARRDEPVGGGVYAPSAAAHNAFTLDGDSDEEAGLRGKGAEASDRPRSPGAMRVNLSAARRGVLVKDLPGTPH